MMRCSMPTADQAFANALSDYARRWPLERDTVLLFQRLLDDREDPFRRERLSGHFTASTWLVSADGGRTLLTHHRKLGMWLQLGGHADGERDLTIAALCRPRGRERGLHRQR